MLPDIILIALLLLNVLIGLKKGFIEMVGHLITLVLALAVSLLLAGPLTSILEKAAFLQPVKLKIAEWTLAPLQKSVETIGDVIRGMKLPPFLEDLMSSAVPSPDSGMTGSASAAISGVLFHFALKAAIFILLFILTALLIRLVFRSLTKLSDAVPVLGTMNRIAGAAAGLTLGAAEVLILLMIAGLAAPYIPAVATAIDQSTLAKYLYSMNILYYLL